MVKTIFTTIVAGVVLTYFGYILTTKSAELKYTLSEKIPSTFLDNNKKEAIQQLSLIHI